MNKLILLFLLSAYSIGYCQEIEYKDYKWSKTPEKFTQDEYLKSLPVVEYKDFRVLEMIIEKDEPIDYLLTHSIKTVNSDDAVDELNKYYVVENDEKKLERLDLRTISPSGKVIELSKKDLIEAVDEQSGFVYKYLALKGLEKGSTIETISLIRSKAVLDGSIVNIQSSILTKNIDLKVIHPSFLKYEFKSYNNAPDPIEDDSTLEEKVVHSYTLDSCPLLESDPHSFYSPNLMSFAYKLVANLSSGAYNLNSFANTSNNVYDFYHKELSKGDIKSLEKFIGNLKLASVENDEKIKAIEKFIKNNFIFVKNYEQNDGSIENFIKNKKGNESDFVRLFTSIFDNQNIEYQLALTNDKRYSYFDTKFENLNQLKEYLFYFPKYNKYMSPDMLEYRYPVFNPYNGGNYGLFIYSKKIGDNAVVAHKTKFIDFPDRYNIDSIYVYVDFTKDINQPSFDFKKIDFGQEAQSLQFNLNYADQKDLKTFLSEYLKNFTDVDESENTIENNKLELIGEKPLVMEAKFVSNANVESIQDKIIFKIGKYIGLQDEMYQEKNRKLPMEDNYPRTYNRQLIVEIPEGYTFDNLDDIKINKELKMDDKVEAAFYSDYKIEGNKLIIDVNEFYNKTFYPVKYFEAYRDVINAASDFNKAKIIVTK